MKYIFTLVMLTMHIAFSQVKIIPTRSNQQWIQYYNTAQISKKFTLQSDIGYRCNQSIANIKVALIRSGLYYSFSPISKMGLGYANFDYFYNKKESKDENRVYFEYSYKFSFKSIKLDNRFRIEGRFFKTPADQYTEIRLRYNLSFTKEIWRHKESDRKLSVFETTELFYTNDTKSNSSYLDQIRLIIGGSFHLNKNLSFQLSYNAQFNKLLAESKTYNFTNILWFTIRQTIDFTKNNEY